MGRKKQSLKHVLSPEDGIPEAIGESEAFLDFQSRVSRVAQVDRSVLLIGERGTGKELAAARIHFLSSRWQKPLVTVNCAALTSTLLESELFGHEAGAFTGARQRRTGRFEAADGGTLFLDEIGQIPMAVQEKIIRVVEYGSFERVGSSDLTQVDVRIIGATNADLPLLAREGKFKPDLLDRLSFEVLFLPPLRERKEDIPILARQFTREMAIEMGMETTPEFSDEAMNALGEYFWPGNVRQLKNVVERTIYRDETGYIDRIQFDPFENPYGEALGVDILEDKTAARTETGNCEDVSNSIQNGSWRPESGPLPDFLKAIEVEALKLALDRSKYQQSKAAEILGISYNQFRSLFRKYRSFVEDVRE